MAARITGRNALVQVGTYSDGLAYGSVSWTTVADTFNWEADLRSTNRDGTAHNDPVERIYQDIVGGTFRATRYLTNTAAAGRQAQILLLTPQGSGGAKVWLRAYNVSTATGNPAFAAVVTLSASTASSDHADMVKETLEGQISDRIEYPYQLGTA